MMLTNNEDMSLSTFDQEDILGDLTSDILIDTINQQIEGLFDDTEIPKNTSDVFETFIQKYNFLKEKYKNNEEFIPELENTIEEITTNILNNIENHFDFKITFSDSLLNDDKIYYIHMIYNFLINNVENNIESLLYNYFNNHINEFPIKDVNSKDLTYINLKSIIPSNYLNQIFYFTENVETIKNYSFFAEDIIELMIENDPMKECNYWCTSIFIDNIFVDINYGDKFISNLIDIALNSNKIYKVQNLIIKKYSSYL